MERVRRSPYPLQPRNRIIRNPDGHPCLESHRQDLPGCRSIPTLHLEAGSDPNLAWVVHELISEDRIEGQFVMDLDSSQSLTPDAAIMFYKKCPHEDIYGSLSQPEVQ